MTITEPQQVLVFENVAYRTSEPLPHTTDADNPTGDSGSWWAVKSVPQVLPTPDVDLPFTQDVEGVHAGVFDFTRSTTTSNNNKSGVVETLAIDEPAITADGLSVYKSYTNLLLQSEALNTSPWVIQSGATVGVDGTLSPDGISDAYYVDNSFSTSSNVAQVISMPDTGQEVTMSWYAKKGTSNIARVRWISHSGGTTQDYSSYFNLDTGLFESGVLEINAKPLSDGWFLLSVTATRNNTGNEIVRVDIAPAAGAQGSIYAWGAQVTETATAMPYIKTEAAQVTRAADIASIPVMNNFPAVGQPFTIALDFAATGETGFLCEIQSRGVGIYESENNVVTLRGLSTQAALILAIVKNTRYRIVITFDGVVSSGYKNGVFSTSSSIPNLIYNLNEIFFIGRNNSGQTIDTEISNFKIWHQALTAEQVKQLGAA